MTTALPDELLCSLRNAPGFNEDSFLQVHYHGEQITSVRVNPFKFQHPISEAFEKSQPVPWSRYGLYLPERPSFTLDPRFHAGVYYVQEPSSMFIEQCLRQCVDLSKSIAVLDLCAAPGGKSTLLQSLISSNSLLVSNEVIKTRVSVLTENLIKWGASNVVVTNNDPSDFKRLESFFDVMVIDAPCSGSGLFRRDPDAVNEWSENAVHTCSLRQQRILTDAYACLKQGGLLVYSTCSYSIEEDEKICDWIMDNFDVSTVELSIEGEWNIVSSVSEKKAAYGYRFYPDKLKGEGFFVACFRKMDGDAAADSVGKKKKLATVPKSALQILRPWLKGGDDFIFLHDRDEIIALPAVLTNAFEQVFSSLYVRKAGTRMGKMIGASLIPHHELALCTAVEENLPYVSLKRDDALQYLRKEEVSIDSKEKGWMMMRYEEWNIGWLKLLGNRSNNYYPKEWRIRKSGNN